jgi:nucleoside phosphorylase
VLSAYPGEIGKNLAALKLEKTVVLENRSFYVGRLGRADVILALTGIGLVNAEQTSKLAVGHFRCGSAPAISNIVFSGVAGGRTFIGDVIVPSRWTLDDGKTWMPVDSKMFAVAKTLKAGPSMRLSQDAKVGDAACLGDDPQRLQAVHVDQVPKLRVGGKGKSTDPFNGKAFTCIPCGGDVFGCEPCQAQRNIAAAAGRFASTAPAFIDPNFILGYFNNPSPATTNYDSEDMESGAVAKVARANRIPFLAFRGVSDGQGDPLGLPGFPFQFFAYRQLAADNAASAVQAFLSTWSRRR